MATFHVIPDATRVPAAWFVASDEYDLGTQVANHFARHKHLRRGLRFDAQIGTGVGAITQPGLRQPLTFTFTEEK